MTVNSQYLATGWRSGRELLIVPLDASRKHLNLTDLSASSPCIETKKRIFDFAWHPTNPNVCTYYTTMV
jgi:hypothetical protein